MNLNFIHLRLKYIQPLRYRPDKKKLMRYQIPTLLKWTKAKTQRECIYNNKILLPQFNSIDINIFDDKINALP
jgi:hypothetical protein